MRAAPDVAPRDTLAVVDATIEQLAQAHGFTLQDLAENRAGRLSETQRARGGARYFAVGCFTCLALVFAVAGVGGALLLYDDYAKPVSDLDMRGLYALGAGGLVVGGICFLVALSAMSSDRRRRAAFAAGAVQRLEGPLQKVQVSVRRSPDEFFYELNGARLRVDRAAWELVIGGAPYRVFCLHGELLSLEPLE